MINEFSTFKFVIPYKDIKNNTKLTNNIIFLYLIEYDLKLLIKKNSKLTLDFSFEIKETTSGKIVNADSNTKKSAIIFIP